MKQLFLHAGMPKTGSSALQVFWARNRDKLIARSIDYFRLGDFGLGVAGKISSGNGAHLARALLNEANPLHLPRMPELLSELEIAISGSSCDSGLLSSEIFIDAHEEALLRFKGWLNERGIQLKLIYFIRRQDQYLASAYVQQVKRHGSTESPETYVLRAYKSIPYLRYATTYERFCALLERQNVHCRSYDAATLSKFGLFDSAMEVLGSTSHELEYVSEDVNVSLQGKELKIMLLLNRVKPSMTFSDLLVENAVRRGDSTTGFAHSIIGEALAREVLSYFSEENCRLAKKYFNRASLFDEAQSFAERNNESDSLTPEDVVNTLGGLCVRFDERLANLESILKTITNKAT